MRKAILPLALLFVSFTVLSGFDYEEKAYYVKKFKFTKKVDAIVQAKCYGCHSEKGATKGPSKALNWDELEGLSQSDFLAKMGAIQNVVDQRVMPPSGMVEDDPEMGLTDKEVKKLMRWTKKLARKNRIK